MISGNGVDEFKPEQKKYNKVTTIVKVVFQVDNSDLKQQ